MIHVPVGLEARGAGGPRGGNRQRRRAVPARPRHARAGRGGSGGMTVVALAQVSGPAGGGRREPREGPRGGGRARSTEGADLVVLPGAARPRVRLGSRAARGRAPSRSTGRRSRPGRELARAAGGLDRRRLRRARRRPALQHRGARRRRRRRPPLPQAPPLLRREGRLHAGRPGAAGRRHGARPDRALHLLRPALRRDPAGAVARRGGAGLRADRLGARASTPQRWDARGLLPAGALRDDAGEPRRRLRRLRLAGRRRGATTPSSAPRSSPTRAGGRGRAAAGRRRRARAGGDRPRQRRRASDRGGDIRPREDRRDDVYSLVLEGRAL